MKRHHTCRTCMHYRPGAASNMSEAAPIESSHDLGVCEADMPQPARLLGSPATVGLQPVVHASRSCSEYTPHIDYDGDNEGEPALHPGGKPVLRSVPRAVA